MAESLPQEHAALEALAREHGVLTSYVDASGRTVHATVEVLVAVLRSLGAPLGSAADAASALAAERAARRGRLIEPVLLADGEGRLDVALRLRPDEVDMTARVAVEPLDPLPAALQGPRSGLSPGGEAPPGALREIEVVGDSLPRLEADPAGGTITVEARLPFPIPYGYHRLEIEVGPRRAAATIVAAPSAAPPWRTPERAWGVFLPLYAVWGRRAAGIGDFTALGDLSAWTGAMGGAFFGTLPLTAAFLDEPHDPSPYAPVSRLFLNEVFVDPWAIPEIHACPEALSAAERGSEEDEQPAPPWSRPLDYRALQARRRAVLTALAADLAGRSTARARAFEEFVSTEPELHGYARFRAATEQSGRPWHVWPARQREGALEEQDAPARSVLYHQYAQWVAAEQMEEAARRARRAGACLYLDAPLGVHPAGYDAWRWRRLFAEGVSTGAPPDALFTGGQDWGFSPPHPERSREDGYRYFAMGLRKAMRHAGLLRIDHVMSLQRLFWVPRGAPAREGVYVGYPRAEMFAVLCLEALRAGCTVVGEDLGTVPGEIREEMRRRSIVGMHVLQLEIDGHGGNPPPPPSGVMASLNTHDMPTFAGFRDGRDLDERRALGLLDDEGLSRERARRSEAVGTLRRILGERGLLREGMEDGEALLWGCLRHAAAGPSALLQVSLEDLWLEPHPQNVPGTWDQRPNWKRRARLALEEILTRREVREILEMVDRERRSAVERRS